MISIVDDSGRVVAVHSDDDTTDYSAKYPSLRAVYVRGAVAVGGNVPSTIDAVRASVKDEIRRRHDAARDAGMKSALGFRVDVKPINVADWMGALQLLEITAAGTVTIRDADNVVHEVTAANYRALCVEIGVFLSGLRATKWTKQAAADAATTVEELPVPDM